MRKKRNKDEPTPKGMVIRLTTVFWDWYLRTNDEETRGVDSTVYQVALRLCYESFDEMTNPRSVAKTSYSDIGRRCGKGWRSTKAAIEALERCGLIHTRATANGLFLMMEEDFGKEEKKRRKEPPPKPPFLKEEKIKEEKGAGKEESAPAENGDFSERRKKFWDSIAPYLAKYGEELCTQFYAHWVEPTPDGEMMRFELQKTWDVGLRLAKWKRYDYKITPNGKRTETRNVNTPEQNVEREKRIQESANEERRRDKQRLDAAPPAVVNVARLLGLPLDNVDRMADGLRQSENADVQQWLKTRDRLKSEYRRKYGGDGIT